MWPPFVERLERALQLAKRLNDAPLADQVITEIEGVIGRHQSDPKFGLLIARLMESLLAIDVGDPELYSSLSEQLARSLAKQQAWDFAEQYWRIASQWYHKAGKDDQAKRSKLQAAEAIANKAEDNLLSTQPSYGFASHWMGRAVEALRKPGAPHERVHQAHQRFIELQRQSTGESKAIPFDPDRIPGFAEATAKQIEAARQHVADRALWEAVFRLAFITQPVDPGRLRERVIKHASEFPFLSLFGSVSTTSTGKVADQSPPLMSTAKEEQEVAVLKNMFLQARTIEWPTKVQFSIDPARVQISQQHGIRIADLAFLVSNNPFIPIGREAIFGRGIQAGFVGDWLVATHLLIPQIESSIRHVFAQYGIPTSTLESDGTQNERDLGWLLNHEKMVEIFGGDIAFDLRGVLTERFGYNLRNSFAHGLLSWIEFHSEVSEYLWWLTIRLCCIGERAISKGDSSINKSAFWKVCSIPDAVGAKVRL